jgi:flagellar basal-body rod protein FlgB
MGYPLAHQLQGIRPMNNISIGKKLLDQTMGLLSRSLDVRTSRHKILSSNIANAETNNFTPKDLPFQKILERYMDFISRALKQIQANFRLI